MIEKDSFWDIEGTESEYKSKYGDYKVLSRTAKIDQIIVDKRGNINLFKNDKKIADTNIGTDLEAIRGVDSVFKRKTETIINLDDGIICRVIEPTHGRIVTSSGDRRLICGNENDVLMQEDDWESEKRRRWY